MANQNAQDTLAEQVATGKTSTENSYGIAQAFLESQLDEYRRIKKMVRFIRSRDETDEGIAKAIDALLMDPPTIEGSEMEITDTHAIIHGLPHYTNLMDPSFFNRTTLTFRLLRRALELHNRNNVKMSQINAVAMHDEDRQDTRIREQVWYLLFIGAPPFEVSELLRRFKVAKPTSSVPSNASSVNDPFRHLRPRPEAAQVRQGANVQLPIAGNAIRCPINMDIDCSKVHRHGTAQAESLPTHQEIPSHQQDVRNREPHSRTPSSHDAALMQVKKGYAVESYFRDRKFTGAPEQSVDDIIRDYEICAIQQCLDESQMSLFFVNALAEPARQFFLANCNSRTPFREIVAQMCRHFNSENRQVQLQSEMDSLSLASFIQRHHISDIATGLTQIVDHINSLAPQLPNEFGDDQHKMRYLRRAVMGFDGSTQTMSQLTVSRFSFPQFITAVRENVQLQEELSRKHTADMNYSQYINAPPSTDFSYAPGDKVLVWREKVIENRIGEWLGPYTVVTHDAQSKIVLVRKNDKSTPERYNITLVKLFIEPIPAATNFMTKLNSALTHFRTPVFAPTIALTEVIDKHDPRASSPEMKSAIDSEVQDLLKRGTFKVILKEELANGANALTPRFVLTIK